MPNPDNHRPVVQAILLGQLPQGIQPPKKKARNRPAKLRRLWTLEARIAEARRKGWWQMPGTTLERQMWEVMKLEARSAKHRTDGKTDWTGRIRK